MWGRRGGVGLGLEGEAYGTIWGGWGWGWKGNRMVPYGGGGAGDGTGTVLYYAVGVGLGLDLESYGTILAHIRPIRPKTHKHRQRLPKAPPRDAQGSLGASKNLSNGLK